MAHSRQPRQHASLADEVRQAIAYATASEAIRLIENGAVDVLDGEFRTPLLHAAIAGKVDVLSWLIEHGADINHQDRNGLSALHYAVQKKHMDAVGALLTNGAVVESKDAHGNTPLWRATFDARGHYEPVQILIHYGANPHSKNKSDRSPLDFAEQIGDEHLIEVLKYG
jgi:ankyrin repeat protein